MRIDKEFGTNKEAEVSGVWVEMGGFSIKVARLSNPKYRNRVKELGAPLRNRSRMTDTDIVRLEEIQRQAVAEHVLLDWKDVEDADGPVEYSAEVGEDYFIRYPDFYNLVVQVAGDMKTFQDDDEADEGN